jgi:hypothetical protein
MLKGKKREAMALDLRAEGMKLEEIAERLGYADRSGAYRAVLRALDALRPQISPEDAEALRRRQLAILHEGQAALLPTYRAGHPSAVSSMVRLLEREAKLTGIDLSADREPPQAPQILILEAPWERPAAGEDHPGEAPNGSHPPGPERGRAASDEPIDAEFSELPALPASTEHDPPERT